MVLGIQILEPIGASLELPQIRKDLAVKVADLKEGDDAFFKDLESFISSDPQNNSRIILYLPFEILPDLRTSKTGPAKKLSETLKESWFRLLFESEMRANFVDGDELEPGMGVPERTRKAAHLLPEFLKRGIISEEDITILLKVNSDSELTKSLIEGVVVANDDNLISPRAWEDITSTYDVRKLLGETTPAKRSLYTKAVSVKRAVWEKEVKIDETTEAASLQLAHKLIDGELELGDIEKFGVTGIRCIVRAVEILSSQNPEEAKTLIEKSLSLIHKFWQAGSPAEREEVRAGVNHLERLNIRPRLAVELEILVPDLSKALPIDIYKFAENGGGSLSDAAKKINNSPSLSEYFFPIILAFGSKIKGYATESGDFDVAVIIKPGVPWKKRSEIISLLKGEVGELAGIDRILEYWISKKDGKYGLINPPDDAPTDVLNPAQIHFLFGGVWIGANSDVQKLRSDLKEKYLDLSRFGNQKDAARSLLLRKLEHDQLQYRLMHKGYRKFYPSQRVAGTKHSNLIDWNSDFWDKGYRQIATQLFLKRVFLPDLSEGK